SSRRRNTRSKRDWSSDVCSSDLDQNRNPSISTYRYSSQPFRKSQYAYTNNDGRHQNQDFSSGNTFIRILETFHNHFSFLSADTLSFVCIAFGVLVINGIGARRTRSFQYDIKVGLNGLEY